MSGKNVLFIMSDEHSKRVAGCYGNTLVRTPNIDRLAEQGTVFDAAYTPCPICVPARAAFATGQYVHDTGNWDNAFPYTGEPEGWGHRLLAEGHRCDSIGKLHYQSTQNLNGFGQEIVPLHVLNGRGDLQGMLRRPPPRRPSTAQLAGDAGEGESSYTGYDRTIRDAAVQWLRETAAQPPDKPWCLFVSFVCPHFPLIAPPEFFRMYDPAQFTLPQLRGAGEFPDHPVVRKLREVQNYEDHFRDEAHVRTAMAAYYGMVSFLDDNIGQVLDALATTGLDRDTLVVYTSDHGDNLGARTLWGKSNMYEESAGVPMVLRGPGIPQGRRVATPVSLLDSYQTIVETVGISSTEPGLPGHSLADLARGPEQPDRTAFSEYHAVGSLTGIFMVRFGQWKYTHYEGYQPELYDLNTDPLETRDLSGSPAHAAVLTEAGRRLRAICDPTEVTARAFADQARAIAANGGEEAVLKSGNFPYTPAPGEKPRISA
ncbi:sulfatase-like hydrolase/transferase [Falsiroseomonas sp. E2-1-a4]|uniref:sulfatase-like hydrolase/transferase n=1 Tax=Falsiroseomonas sp. E2-1-a4 TaxID=3239299 RepID=UPI003F37AF4A